MLDSRGPIPGMTATGALVAIQEMATHSQKWHDEGSFRGLGGSNSYGMSVGHVMRKLKESVHTIQVRSSIEETIRRYMEGSSKRQDSFKEWMKRFRESTNKNLKRHDSASKGLEKKVEQLAQEVHASITNDSKSVMETRRGVE
ncbi:hypothetical protein Tco_1242850 [Tanacetum coccineum]